VLLNLYRNGVDSMGWHSDDERELGERPVIASVSLGATRRFRLRHK
jgi:alkylated DNA repair dioxygenase AlkB